MTIIRSCEDFGISKLVVHVKLVDELSISIHPSKEEEYKEDFVNHQNVLEELEEVKSEDLEEEAHDVDEDVKQLEDQK